MFLFFQLCTVITLIPLVLSLHITFKESLPKAFQSTQISLHRDQYDPPEFVLGAFTVDGKVAVTTNQVVKNFTADRIVNMTFNYTSSSGKDCILFAWLYQFQLRNNFTQSEPFSVTNGPTTTVTSTLITTTPLFLSTSPTSSPTTSSPATSSSTSSVSGNTQSKTKAIPTEAVVGAIICAFVLLSIISAALFILLWQRRNRKLKESAPSRAFWRYLDRKGPPISRPVPPEHSKDQLFARQL